MVAKLNLCPCSHLNQRCLSRRHLQLQSALWNWSFRLELDSFLASRLNSENRRHTPNVTEPRPTYEMDEKNNTKKHKLFKKAFKKGKKSYSIKVIYPHRLQKGESKNTKKTRKSWGRKGGEISKIRAQSIKRSKYFKLQPEKRSDILFLPKSGPFTCVSLSPR